MFDDLKDIDGGRSRRLFDPWPVLATTTASVTLLALAALGDQCVHDVAAANDSDQLLRLDSCDHRNAVVRFRLKQNGRRRCRGHSQATKQQRYAAAAAKDQQSDQDQAEGGKDFARREHQAVCGHAAKLREREFAAKVEQNQCHGKLQQRLKLPKVGLGQPIQDARPNQQPDQQNVVSIRMTAWHDGNAAELGGVAAAFVSRFYPIWTANPSACFVNLCHRAEERLS